MKFETLAIHAGQAPDAATGATIVPVYQTVTFTQDAIGEDRGFVYSRSGNPTRSALETCIAALEGARFGLAYASGMAAIAVPGPWDAWLTLRGGEAAARKLCKATRVFSLGESLGGVESLIGYPFLMSHAAFSPEEKRAKGITESVVRLSVGLEDAGDLCDDLLQALAQCR